MKLKLIISFFVFFSFSSYAEKNHVNVKFGLVSKIDSNQVIHIKMSKGKVEKYALAYLETPVKGEAFYEDSHRFLIDMLLGHWVRVSDVGVVSAVKHGIIKTKKGEMVNMAMVARGLSIPSPLLNPPRMINKAAEVAKDMKLGIWRDRALFHQNRMETMRKNSLLHIKSAGDAMANAKKLGLNGQPVVAFKMSKTYKPVNCLTPQDLKGEDNYTFYVNLHRPERDGYKRVDCPSSKKTGITP